LEPRLDQPLAYEKPTHSMFFVVSLYWFLFLQTFFYEEHQLASSKNTYLVTWVTQLAQKAKLELGM
jgi:hypothetical protein